MRYFVYCKHCNNKIRVKGNFTTRYQLYIKKGDEFELRCSNCNQKSVYNVDLVKAKTGIGTFALFLFFTTTAIILWILYPYFERGIITMFLFPLGVLIPALIYVTILKEQKRKTESFNKTRINDSKSIKFSKKF